VLAVQQGLHTGMASGQLLLKKKKKKKPNFFG